MSAFIPTEYATGADIEPGTELLSVIDGKPSGWRFERVHTFPTDASGAGGMVSVRDISTGRKSTIAAQSFKMGWRPEVTYRDLPSDSELVTTCDESEVPTIAAYAREWASDCDWSDTGAEDIEDMSDVAVIRAAGRHYDGGIAALRLDALADADMSAKSDLLDTADELGIDLTPNVGEVVGIGTYTLSEPRTERTTEEVAAWFTAVDMAPQTVPVFAKVGTRGASLTAEDTSLGYALVGTVSDAHYPALFGGVAVSDGKRPNMIGKPHTIHHRPYAHAVAHAILEGRETAIRLNPDWEAVYVGYGDPTSEEPYCGYTASLMYRPDSLTLAESRGIAAGIDPRGCVSSQDTSAQTAAFQRGYARGKHALAERLAREAKSAASSATYVWRDAIRTEERAAVTS